MKNYIWILLFLCIPLVLQGCSKKETEKLDFSLAEHDPTAIWNEQNEQEKKSLPGVDSGNSTKTEQTVTNNDDGSLWDIQTTPIDIFDPDAGKDTKNASLEPHVVVLDPGHGGSFTGAIYDVVEKEVSLKIAEYIKEYLNKEYPSLTVYLTRETDKDFDEKLAKDLENRVQYGKELGGEIFVSLHLNASEKHDISGCEVLCPHRDNVKEASFALANCILDELEALGIKRRGIVTRNSNDLKDENGKPLEYYAINRHAANRDMVGIIVEHCFMDHVQDKRFLIEEEELRKLAKADARGIVTYFYPDL